MQRLLLGRAVGGWLGAGPGGNGWRVEVVHSETHLLLMFGVDVFERVKEGASLFSGGRKILEDGGGRVASMETR